MWVVDGLRRYGRWSGRGKLFLGSIESGRGKFIFGSIELGVANFFLGQSIGLAETNTFQLKFFIRGKLFFGSIDRY